MRCWPFSSHKAALPSYDQAHNVSNVDKRPKPEQGQQHQTPTVTAPLVVFVYEGRNLLFPRPATYNDAVSLVQTHMAHYDLSKSEVRFTAQLAWLLPDEEIEVTPTAWADAIPTISRLQVVIQPKTPLKATSQAGSCPSSPVTDDPRLSTAQVAPPIVPPKIRHDSNKTRSRGTPHSTSQTTSLQTREKTNTQYNPGMHIQVRSTSGKVISMSGVQPTHSVRRLKEKIQDKEGTPAEQQQLTFEGVEMEDGKNLSDYNVVNNSTIMLGTELFLIPQEVRKPVIYLYPPVDMDVKVKLSLVPQWRFSAIYPIAHIDEVKPTTTARFGQKIEWDVHALKNGILTDKRTGSDVAYLFWEAQINRELLNSPPVSRPGTPSFSLSDESFLPGITRCDPSNSVLLAVKDVPSYLDSSLLVLGLHTEARTSFITYWLPDVLKHSHVALRFVPQLLYEKAAPLEISPSPDVVTRVFMVFQGVNESDCPAWTEAAERAKETSARWKQTVGIDESKQADESLFRVIEWGGMEVK